VSTPRPPAEPGPIGPLRVPKAGDVLAEELAGRIARGELPEGTGLPAERTLVAQTGLSRTSVREALRILEVQGLVEIRTGRSGGAFVRRPSGHGLATSVRLEMRGGHVSLGALLQTRAAVEPRCAGLAAAHRDEAALAHLEVANRALAGAQDVQRFLRANVEWHVAVAVASGNELLSGLMEALAELIYDATGQAGPVDARVRAETCRAHLAITEAVRAGDRALAEHRMQRHVHAYVDAVGDEADLDWTGAGRPAAG
jgi:GntR family transcriptional regulator, transcriptional repressor for pyruvate dehydrogenase complex